MRCADTFIEGPFTLHPLEAFVPRKQPLRLTWPLYPNRKSAMRRHQSSL